MGAGIGQLCAQQGYEVTVVDISNELIDRAKNKITTGLKGRIEKGKITQEDMDSVLSRMNWSTDLELARECDFVVEAIYEDIEVKKDVFSKLDSICSPETILATNTTALSVSEIASATSRVVSHMTRETPTGNPSRFCGSCAGNMIMISSS